MDIISGIFYRNGRKPEPGLFEGINIAEGIVLKAKATHISDSTLLVVHTDKDASLFWGKDEVNGLYICGDVVLYHKETLIQSLELSHSVLDVELVLAAYTKWGEGCMQYLTGEFAFAIWDKNNKTVFAAKDQLGHRPFFYHLDDDVFIFSTRIQVLAAFSFAEDLNEKVIIDHLQLTRFYRDETIYEKIKRLLPAYQLTVNKKEQNCKKYWSLKSEELNIGSLESAINGFKLLLERAVKDRVNGMGKTGVELSGGIDSSAVAALAANELKQDVNTIVAFSNVLAADYQGYFENYGDEWAKAASVATHSGIKQHYRIEKMPEDTFLLFDKALDVFGYPTNFFLSLAQTGVYSKAAEMGIIVLLSGFGGDEIVSQLENNRYVSSLIRSYRFGAVVRHFQKMGMPLPKATAIAGYMLGRFVLKLGKKQNKKTLKQRWSYLLLNKNLHNNKELKDVYMKNPFFFQKTLADRVQFFINSGGMMARLETGYLISSYYGFQYRYPLLDIKLVEYYYSLKDEWKASHKYGRGIFRKAIKGLVPDAIVNQPKVEVITAPVVPFQRIERDEYFNKFKDWILSCHKAHEIFIYIDREKIASLKYEINNKDNFETRQHYDQLKSIVLLGMFINKTRNRQLREV